MRRTVGAFIVQAGPTYPDAKSAERAIVRDHERFCRTKVKRIRCTESGDSWRCTYAAGTGSGSTTIPKDDGGHPEVQIIC